MGPEELCGRWQSFFSSLKPSTIPPPNMTANNTATDGGGCGRLELLSAWNQNSPRVYIAVVLCFPFDNGLTEQASQHLRSSLQRLGQDRPLFASRLRNGCSSHQGLAHLERSPDYEIPFEVSLPGELFKESYAQVKAAGFPPDLFINPVFGVPGGIDAESAPLPASMVHAFFVDGGLFLAIYLHHSLCDGDSLRVFLECFAAQTKGEIIDRPSNQAFSDKTRRARREDLSSFGKLISNCPEYAILPQSTGPTQPRFVGSGVPLEHIEKTGRIFVFSKSRIEELQELMRKHLDLPVNPSKYTCLAALTFAHVSKSRLQCDDFLPDSRAEVATLWNSVSWRTRAFQGQTKEYFGNAALPAVTKAPIQLLGGACQDSVKLASLIPLVRASIDAVDEEYVRRRLAMISASPDPRLIGVNYDPRMPEALAFNTWRHFGADAEWDIPGVPVEQPDAIRRAHGSWNLGTALILPARSSSPSQELFVSLSKPSMEILCEDEEWLQWVDRVIG